MGQTLKWTERASSDIEAIVRYLARRNPEAAARIGEGVFERAQELVSHPELGSVETSLHGRFWRKLIYRRWKIIYTFCDDVIVIGRVWPCALGEVDLTRSLEDDTEK